MAKRRKKATAKKKRQSAVQKAKEAAMARGGTISLPTDYQFYNPKPGVHRIGILGFEVKEGNPNASPGFLWYERTFWQHRGIGPNNETVICPSMSIGMPCPICEYRSKLSRRGEEQLVDDLKPKKRQIFNVYDFGEPENAVQVWDISPFLFGDYLEAELEASEEEASEVEFFYDPDDFCPIRIKVVEDSYEGHRFSKVDSVTFRPGKETIDDEIWEQALCLDDLIKVMPYEKLKSLFLQTPEDSEDEDDEEEEKPKRRRRKPPEPEEDEEEEEDEEPEEDDEEEDDEEEEEPKPRRRKAAAKKPAKRGRKPKEPEPEEDEEDEDEVPFEVGDKVEHVDFGVCEITKISKDGTSYTILDDDGDEIKAVSRSELSKAEDEEEDEEEEEPEEKPKKRSRRRGKK